MDNITTIALLGVIAALLYRHIHKLYSFWSDRGVPGPRPIYPFGNLIGRLSKSQVLVEHDLFKRYGRVFGFYLASQPVLSISDPELIKQVTIKDFPTFVNRRQVNTYHPLWNENLFMVDDEKKWKRLRSITSPTFTSGKLKGMQTIMTKSVENLEKYFDHILEGKHEAMEIDVKEILSGLTMDIIATTTFATEIDSNNSTKRNNEFVRMISGLFNINIVKGVFASLLTRPINDLLGIRFFFPAKNFEFLCNLTKQIVKTRIEDDSIKRTDLVQLLLNASVDKHSLEEITNYDRLTASMDNDHHGTEGTNKTTATDKLTHDEIIAQCIIFFIAGFETTASTMSYLVYEMAKNADMQTRLVDELSSAVSGLEANSSEYHDKIMTLPYLDAVIKETMRKYPPIARLFRMAGRDTRVGNIDIPKGTNVFVSIYALHHDPDNYEHPERFDPERFMAENRDKLKPFTYLPFGSGPRNCVGMRFAIQEIKICMAWILRKFSFTANDKTPEQLVFKKGLGLLQCMSNSVSVSRR